LPQAIEPVVQTYGTTTRVKQRVKASGDKIVLSCALAGTPFRRRLFQNGSLFTFRAPRVT